MRTLWVDSSSYTPLYRHFSGIVQQKKVKITKEKNPKKLSKEIEAFERRRNTDSDAYMSKRFIGY